MASLFRYRAGVVAYIALPTNSSYPIEEGDLCWKHSDNKVYPAYAYYAVVGDAGTAAQNRAAFATKFAGIAVKKTGLTTGETSFRLTTDPGYTVLAISGDWEYDCAATSWVTGDLVGVYNDATYNSNQKVALVTASNEVIGVAKVPYNAIGASLTSVVISIRTAVMHDEVVSGQ